MVRSRKGALGHPIPTPVITSDLSLDPAQDGGDTEMFSGSQTHWIGVGQDSGFA